MGKLLTVYECEFYNAGFTDATEQKQNVVPYKSKRYIDLLIKNQSKIGDVRGDGTKAYLKGVYNAVEKIAKHLIEEIKI